MGLAVTDYILDAMDRKQITTMVLLDFTKAFDSISHSLLLKKLQNFGVSPNALRWFASYLFQRKQQVRIGKTLSSSRTVTHGVPQAPSWDHYCSIYISMTFPMAALEQRLTLLLMIRNSMQHLKLLISRMA